MKKILIFALPMLLALNLGAQTNEPAVRLALITETDEASAASDVLTAQLSGNPRLHLLERNEIEKVYREQGLSAANQDYLKLGRILGADGLLLFDLVQTKAVTNLTARLIAVKPGVVLTDGSFPWPLKDTVQWAESVATYLNSFLPKLSVLVKDAIPISVVNLRSAVQSVDALETERQLKLLTIQRLSQERQFFVLERQRMQLLGEEKELKADESAFWNGSYLLEGVVDQNGYSKDVITINARLTPPKGGAPLLIEVSGSRTNYAEVINRLAAKITELLKVNSTVKEWNAADEAQQYNDEAKWALRWGIYSEAQAAAESAWALGKHDVDCATLRVRAYMISPDAGEPVIDYPPRKRPDPQTIAFALHALELYSEFSRNLPPDQTKVDSDWYRLGIEDLIVTSRVLQLFHWSPDYYQPVAEKLAELRAAARSTAEWISQLPSVHDSYFVGDRVVVYDELCHFEEKPSIFGLKADCGCLWQETPEDGVALYRELMSSPVFCYLHDRFWFRDTYHRTSLFMAPPQLIAWNEADQERIPTVWNSFFRELNTSTNLLMQLEAKALVLANANSEPKLGEAFTNFFNAVFENRDALIANNVEVLYLEWRIGDLVERMGGDSVSDTKDSLQHLYYSEYRPKLEAMDREYRDKMVAGRQNDAAFEKQKQYLKDNTPYNFAQFVGTFSFFQYSQAQAAELQPLLAAYKSNLVAKAGGKTGMEKMQIRGAIAQVGFAEDRVNRVLNPPTTVPPPQMPAQAPKPAPAAKPVVAVSAPANAPEIVTKVIAVTRFLAIPLESLFHLTGPERITSSSATSTAHHWFDGRLLLDFRYGASIGLHDGKENVPYFRDTSGTAIALFDPAQARWEVIECPKAETLSQNNFYHRSVLVRGDLFTCDGGQIRKYDFQNQRWQVLPISDGGHYELFAVHAHLYAANQNLIFEIVDGGNGTRLMASNRRRPAASALDTQDLGTPTLFAGPGHSLRVSTKNKIFTWTGDDWREVCAAPPASSQPEVFMDGVLFRQAGSLSAAYQNGVIYRQPNGVYGVLGGQDEISCLANETNTAKLCLGSGNQADSIRFPGPGTKTIPVPKPFWETPANLLPNLPAALRQSDLYILEDAFAAHAIVNDRHEVLQDIGKDEYNAALLCFSNDLPKPLKLFLKFDAPEGYPPVAGINPGSSPMFSGIPTAWMLFSTNYLLCGMEDPGNFPTGGAGRTGSKPGVWMIPLDQVESAVAAQKQIQLEQKSKDEAAAKSGQTQ